MGFVKMLRKQAEDKAEELRELYHEKDIIQMKIHRNAMYIRQLNDFLVQEGCEPVDFDEQK